jgi:hypothetical protein
MHGNLRAAKGAVTDQTDSASDQSANEWFISLAGRLYPKDAGLAMHLVTGFEDRTCYRYAAGDRKTPGYLIYVLLRSDHGRQWYAAIMDGCRAKWWLERQERRRQLTSILREIEAD